MNKQQFIENINKFYAENIDILIAKNQDYAGDGDPFRNFKNSALVGVATDRAILVRISDKLARIANLLDKEPEVANERIEDSLSDICNYCAILHAYLKQKKD